jgi:hypothetical protein
MKYFLIIATIGAMARFQDQVQNILQHLIH